MNILIFSTHSHYSGKPIGGAETSLRLIAEKFSQIREKVIYVTTSLSKIPRYKKEKINGVIVYTFTPLRWPFLGGRLFPKTRKKFINYQRQRFLAKIIEKEKIKVVHTYDTSHDTYDILKLREKYKLGFKVVKRVAGLFWAFQLENKMVAPEKVEWVFNNVDIVNFISPGLRELSYKNFRKHQINLMPKKEIIMDIGINLDRFNFHWNPFNNGTFKIVCVSRFTRQQKRQDLLIEAVSKIKKNNINIQFLGAGEMLDSYRKRVNQLGIEDRVTFHGFVSQRDLIEILINVDVFALPTDYEGVPKALLEAMIMGIPCLVSDVSPLNSYIVDGVNGYLTLNTADKWAEKIEMICAKRNGSLSISSHAREFVLQNYDANKNILRYKVEFLRLIDCLD